MYKVIKAFTDLQDGNHVYFHGEPYPRNGYTPTEDRVAELVGKNNKLGCPIIVKTTDTPEEAHERVLEAHVETGTGENSPKPAEAKRTPKEARGKASKNK